MAELGSLSVSLSLDSSNFNNSISQVDRNLKSMGSELKAVRARGADYSNSLDGLSKRQDILRRSVEAAGIKLRETRRVYDELVASGKASDAQLERQAKRVNDAQTQFNRLERELKQVESALKAQSSPWKQLGQDLTDAGNKIKTFGDGASRLGRDLSMRVTAPIVGMGAAILKSGMDFEAAMSKVRALSGATGSDMEKLEEQAKELGATTKFSATEAAEGMAFLAMAGWETKDILAGMPGLLDLAAAGAMDLGRAADITSNIMSAFSIEASEAGHVADVLAEAATNANTTVEQMGTAMTYLAPVANTLGWSLEESAAAVMAMSDAGIQGEKAGAAFATSLQRLANPTKQMKEVMDELNITFFDAEGRMKPLPQIIGELEEATDGLEDKQKAAALSTLFGAEAYKNWSVILEEGSESLGKNTEMLENAGGAAKRVADELMNNAKGSVEEFRSALAGLSIELSAHILPAFTNVIEKGTELARKFGELSPGTQKLIIGFGGVAAAIGPVVWAAGSLISSIGSIVKVAGMASTAIAGAGGLGAVLTAVTGPIGLTVAAIAGLTAAGIALYNHLKKDAIPEIDLFGDSVSEATQKAVSGFLELNDQATVALNELSWSGKEVTQEMADEMVGIFDQMGDQVLSAMQEDHAKELEAMTEFFANSEALTEEQEAKILERTKQAQTEQEQVIANGRARIAEIWQQAAEENRGITEQEQIEINQIQQTMTENAVQYMSDSEVEQKIILERLQRESSKITAQQAAEVVKNSKKQKEETIEEAEAQFREVEAWAIRQRDETGAMSEEEAAAVIAEAKRKRDETVKNAEEMHKKVVSEAQKQAEEHIEKVDWETGEILSKWDVFVKNFVQKQNDLVQKASENWGKLLDNTKEMWEKIKAWPGQKLDEMNAAIDTKMAEAGTIVRTKWNDAEEFLKNINLLQVGKDIIQGLIDGINEKASGLLERVQSIASQVKSIMTSAFSIFSPSRWMRDMIGKNMMLGWIEGIESMRSQVLGVASVATEWMKPDVPNLSALNMTHQDGRNDVVHTSTTTKYSPTIINHYHQPIDSPSELSRKQTQNMRNLALNW